MYIYIEIGYTIIKRYGKRTQMKGDKKMDYGKYGFELVDEKDREWEIIIKDKPKVREIAKRMNYEQLNLQRVSCSIFENENIAVLLITSLNQSAPFNMSIEELLKKIS